MSTVTERNTQNIADATCTFCGCLCDDIALSTEGDAITKATNACSLGEQWFFSQHSEQGPACLIDGRPSSLDEGIARAARILHEARYPIVFGLCETTSAAQRAAVSLADWAGACVDATAGNHGATALALQEVGEVTCTLGEVKERGDLIIFWGCNPVESHPRHLSRYSLEPAGEFVPGGRADRFCVVVDDRETATALLADQFIAIKPGKDFEALWILRALAKDVELDAGLVEAETGVSLSTWRELMSRMKHARYGVIFSGSSQQTPFDTHQYWHAIFALVRDMNAYARFVCVSMGGPGNAAGAENVMTWQTGYPFAVDLGRGYPRFGPRDFAVADVLERAECDAALIVAKDLLSRLTPAAREHLDRIPTIVLHCRDTATAAIATVALRTATYGINTPGTVYRADGVPISLRPALPSPWPSDEEMLKRIEGGLREMQAAGVGARIDAHI
jgi:formylmethanofuran dehydrogenase subunit B